jgi:hypothetical protein
MTPGEWDKLAVVVMGMSPEAIYSISCKTAFSPHVAGFVTLQDTALAVFVANGLAYVADDDYGLQIVDVSNPQSPQLRGRYDTPGQATAVRVVGNRAYVADKGGGLQIIDVSNPDSPQFIGKVGSYALGVEVVGDHAYVAAGRGGDGYGYFRVFNITDPTFPQEAYLRLDYNTTAYGIAVSDQHAFVTDTHTGALYVVDIQDPKHPLSLGMTTLNWPTQGVFATSQYVYVANGDLQVVDVCNPAAPTVVGSLVGGAEYTLFVQNGHAYAGGAGVVSLNVTDPLNPGFEFFVDTPDYVRGVFVSGAYA